MKVKFMDWDCTAIGTQYATGDKAIQLVDSETGEPIATATVCLPDESPPDGSVFIKEWSENAGMTQALVDAGIIHKEPSRPYPSGFVEVYAHTLTPQAQEELFNV